MSNFPEVEGLIFREDWLATPLVSSLSGLDRAIRAGRIPPPDLKLPNRKPAWRRERLQEAVKIAERRAAEKYAKS